MRDGDMIGTLGGQDIHVHHRAKEAYVRRVADVRQKKQALVQVTLHIKLHDNIISTLNGLTLPASTVVIDFRHSIKPFLEDWVNRQCDNPFAAALLEDRNKPVWYCAALRTTQFGKDHWINADATAFELNIDCLADLFTDPADPGNKLEILADLKLDEASALVQQWSTQGRVSSGAVEPGGMTTPWECERLGTSPAKAGSHRLEPQLRDAVIAYRFQGEQTDFDIARIPMYGFGHFCVGDVNCQEVYKALFVKPKKGQTGCARFKFLPPFADANGRSPVEGLQDKIKQMVAARPRTDPVGNGVPVLPSYTFNDFDPSASGMMSPDFDADEKSKKLLRFAVRCAGNVNLPEDHVIFPRDIRFQLAIDTKNIASAIRGEIVKHLRKETKDSYGSTTSQTLCKRRDWHIELWMMPQEPGETKLYRFADVGDKQGRVDITHFLDISRTDRGDYGLLVMAHLLEDGFESLVTARS